MRVWQKYLPQIMAFQLRAKQLEDALNAEELMHGRINISPNQVFKKLDIAHDAKELYIKAHRLCLLVRGVEDYGAPRSLTHLQKTVELGMRRINDIINLLNNKVNDWGLKNNTPSEDMSDFALEDENAVIDEVDSDSLKSELRQTLKALADIIEYMERPTLLKIRKELNRLVHY